MILGHIYKNLEKIELSIDAFKKSIDLDEICNIHVLH
ncbi:tetratricopeptide repeat protein [Campylobacter lari]